MDEGNHRERRERIKEVVFWMNCALTRRNEWVLPHSLSLSHLKMSAECTRPEPNIANNSIFTGTNISFIWLCLYWNIICALFGLVFHFQFCGSLRFLLPPLTRTPLTKQLRVARGEYTTHSILKWYEKWRDHATSCFVIICQFAAFISSFFHLNEKENLWNEMPIFRFDTHAKQINKNGLNWSEKLKVSISRETRGK